MDEIESMQKTIDENMPTPDAEFEQRLESQLLAENQNPAYLNFDLTNMSQLLNKKVAIVGVLLCTLILVMMGTGAFLYLNARGLKQADKSDAEIFAAMFNAGGTSANSTAEADTATAGDAKLSSLIAYQENKTYTNYEGTSEAGPMVGKCEGMIPYGLDYIKTVSASYYEENNESYSKYVTTNKAGQVLTYSLSQKDKLYEYNGGNFAVSMPTSGFGTLEAARSGVDTYSATAEETTDAPVAAEPAPDTSVSSDDVDQPVVDEPARSGEFKIEDYFGVDAKVLGQETIDGQKYYVVSWSYDNYCGQSASTMKVINKVWVNADTYNYDREEIYAGSIAGGNLMVTNINKSTERIAEYSEVKSEFQFDLNVQVREVNPNANEQGSTEYLASVRRMLASEKLQVLMPRDPSLELQSYTADRLDLPNPNAFRLERNFYITGTTGDKMFTEAKNIYSVDSTKSAYLTTYFYRQDGEKFYNLSYEIYGSEVTAGEMREKIGDPANLKSEKITMSIGVSKTSATLYDLSESRGELPKVEIDVDRPGSQSSPSYPGTSKSYVVTFLIDSKQYLLRFDGDFSKNSVKLFAFATLNGGVSADLNQFMASVKDIKADNDLIAL